MSIHKLSLRVGAAALFATFAALAATPSAAVAASGQAGVTQTATEFSAARRSAQKPARVGGQRRAVRDAYGAYTGGAGAIQSSGNYGYGVGDNARGQTW